MSTFATTTARPTATRDCAFITTDRAARTETVWVWTDCGEFYADTPRSMDNPRDRNMGVNDPRRAYAAVAAIPADAEFIGYYAAN